MSASDERRDRPGGRVPLGRIVRIAVLAVIAGALAIAAAAWLFLLIEGDDDAAPASQETAELATVDDLLALAESSEDPVYWAGARAGTQYELTRTADGRIYIRYLPPGVEVGDRTAGQLTVGTYPLADALAATRTIGDADGAVVRDLPGGGVAVYNESSPTSVYLAFPGIDRQVEVYDPSPEEARQLAYSGAVVAIGDEDELPPEQTGRPVAATQSELEELSGSLDHPLYWSGPRPGFTYELTRLPNGQIFIRYLPRGVDVGDSRPIHETIGTYPLDDALSAVRAAADRAGDEAVTFDVEPGGLAYYTELKPTNVYFALPGEDTQIEVFHPSAEQARKLVQSGAVVTIG